MKFIVKMRGGNDAPITKVVDADETFDALQQGVVVFQQDNQLVFLAGTAQLISIEPVR